jgi:hypothetical protein
MLRFKPLAPSTTQPAVRSTRWRKAAAALAVAAGLAVVPLVADPASAGVGGCWSGIDSGTVDWAWGSCTGVTGNTHWRLHVSCTWGDTRYSSWFYGDGRTDVQCPWPETVRATQIDIIY